jgi:hypothetical protein
LEVAIDLRAGDQPRAALEGSTADPWSSLTPAAFQPALSVALTSARNRIFAGAAAIRRTHFAVIDYAFLVGGGVASRITVTALSPECLRNPIAQRLTENELSDFSRLWHDGCGEAIIEAQDVDRNHSRKV